MSHSWEVKDSLQSRHVNLLVSHLRGTSISLLAMFFFATLLLGAAAPAIAAPQMGLAPRIHWGRSDGSWLSTNWSGYAVNGSAGSVSDVRGSWKVPAIAGSCPKASEYSSFWVGIDGFSSNTVEQIGTDSDCQNGRAAYYAWYEFYPSPSYTISSFTVKPGDTISAEVNYSNSKFTVSIVDVTTGKSYSTSATVKSAQKSSAEWIAEAPSSSRGVLPLADFGTVNFGSDNTGVAVTCYATVAGATKALGSFSSSVQELTMVTSSGKTVKAQPSSVSKDGTSFSVVWKSSGP
ncbi:MAG TPA: G1 family glutamic endopeptidase [Candidatus Acidoferrum sp.]|nr:G1 family glutamic endopeptidase [Candidatus Acidoferrum sp.]